jgi:pyruvate formate lyase activating enzyme
VKSHVERVHGETRKRYGLPELIPRGGSVRCDFCVNRCEIQAGGIGYCGVRKESCGKLEFRSGGPERAYLDYYYDPLPTNCVADWVCPGNRMRGKYNLAVFYRACSFDCLFCQNYTFRHTDFARASPLSDEELARCVTDDTACVCYFGGDPTPQAIHSTGAASLLLERGDCRVCWETNGSMKRAHLDRMIEVALRTGGIIKFDLKALNEELNTALCGTSNRWTLDNFEHLASQCAKRSDPPLAVASTLLVPGYIDCQEIFEICRFIASLDKRIPYSFLGFHPHCNMSDLPPTSFSHAAAAVEIAREAGLANVHIGNAYLLSRSDYPLGASPG